jgi:hypothetical protein
VHHIWVRRANCSACAVSHALLPSFCLPGRRYAVETIGPTVENHAKGTGTRKAADAISVWESTARTWCRRHRERAELTLAVAFALAACLGASVSAVAASVEATVLSALDPMVAEVCEAEGLAYWSAMSLVTEGMWLAPVKSAGPPRSTVFSDAPEEGLMAGIDRNDEEKPP